MVYFLSNFADLYILTLSGHLYAKRGRSFAEKFDRRPASPTIAPACSNLRSPWVVHITVS